MMRTLLIALVACSFTLKAFAQDTLLPTGSVWKYLDDGSDQGTAWVDPAFDDSTWSSGPAQLGYGDGDEATVVSFGPDAANKFRTTYFRTEFDVVDPSSYVTLELRMIRDDGAVCYLNGTEVARIDMPLTSNYLTFASATAGAEDEDIPVVVCIPPDQLVAGANVIAVEIHQRTASSSDVSFDLEVLGDTELVLKRGPYLQLGTEERIFVRWRTNLPTDSRVWWGDAPGNLQNEITLAGIGVDHEIEITNLSPETQYYYAVGDSNGVLVGDDAEHFFVTSPVPGTDVPTRVWIIGDSGTGAATQLAVRDAYATFAGSTHTDLWLMLGDNAYTDGSDAQYQVAVFEAYEELLRKSVVWPTRGNHENSLPDYLAMFTLPASGEAGGVPSGTESYYSFDHANIHFVCLDSDGSNRAVGGAMWTWLESDLQATDQDWIIAYWHHPPYTAGSHDSNTETKLVEMRTNFAPLLEANGVDLVFCGHSHSYERSFLLNGHYGISSTLVPGMILDAGAGDPSGSGAYRTLPGPNSGTVYTVAGSSGKISTGPLDHPAMFVSLLELGSVVLDVNGDVLDVSFLDDTGAILDTYRIESTGFSFCHGDGGDQAGCTACPCSNDAPIGTVGGCLNQTLRAAELIGSGSPRVFNDSLRFEVERANPNTFGVLVSGDNALPNSGPCPPGSGVTGVLLDGLRCVGGNFLRHGARPTDLNGGIGVVTNGWGPPSGPIGGLIANGGFAAGQTRRFQCFYREDTAVMCMTGQNTTNGVEVSFVP